jgi:hypothetical protein
MREAGMYRRRHHAFALAVLLCATAAWAQRAPTAAQLAPGQACTLLTQANADASAGTPNVKHDGSPLPGVTPPDIANGFKGIPRSAQPPLTASQRRILECTYRLAEANADMPYTLFVPSSYRPSVPTPLVVDLHGLNITPLQQMLFDGTTDFAERFGFIVVTPMGFSVSSGWGERPGQPVATAQMKPSGTERYSAGELAEIDAMSVLKMIREKYTVDDGRIYLMGHSMGGGGTYYLGAKYKDIWAGDHPSHGLAPVGAGAPGRRRAPRVSRVPW